ncbi:TetR/AcrR family transcriptional regulator [Paenibacillus bouchesdurhonensis]|uniref:TetR/AcrR family transcriptional regulator n=1 Tax=Paenibacillus bouchesdurhonensis TaxID=1870990 RepID=UPI0018FF7F4D|nr:TetR/AcrR family transcriptional regulator [Paenibacillus bouchesdurhonensis]
MRTKDRILHAACIMMAERGYQNVTVKEIADRAGCSEMTVFRQFKTKLGILQELVTAYSYIPFFDNMFKNELTGDIEKDLEKIARVYLSYMHKNKPIFLIAVQERGNLPELLDSISKQNTQQLQGLLAQYFEQLMIAGKLRSVNAQEKAIDFLTTLFGFFASITLWENHFLHDREEAFIESVIDTFLNGICLTATNE